jgi:hypothetical protein
MLVQFPSHNGKSALLWGFLYNYQLVDWSLVVTQNLSCTCNLYLMAADWTILKVLLCTLTIEVYLWVSPAAVTSSTCTFRLYLNHFIFVSNDWHTVLPLPICPKTLPKLIVLLFLPAACWFWIVSMWPEPWPGLTVDMPDKLGRLPSRQGIMVCFFIIWAVSCRRVHTSSWGSAWYFSVFL